MSLLNRIFKGRKDWLLLLALLPFFVFLVFNLATGVLAQSGEQQLYGWAWSSNIGWTKLHGEGANVVVGQDGNLSGYAWNAHLGWLDFDPTGTYPEGPPHSAKIEGDTITGWARFCSVFESGCSGPLKDNLQRGGWDGWIRMENVILGSTQTSVPSGYSYREIAGYAWGSDEFVGWIDLAPEIDVENEPCTDDYIGPLVICGVEEPPLVVSCSMSPTSVNAGEVSTGSSNVSGGDGSYTYEWFANRNNTSFLPIEDSDNSEMDITFTQNGNYQVRLIVQDGSGASGMASCGNVEVSGEWNPYRALCDGPVTLEVDQDGVYEGSWEFVDVLTPTQRENLENNFTFRWYNENWSLLESQTTDITRSYSQEGDYINRFVIYHPSYTATDASCNVNVGEGLQVACKASVASGDGVCIDDRTCFIGVNKNIDFEIDTNIENQNLNYWKQNMDLILPQLGDPGWLSISNPFSQVYNYSEAHRDRYSSGVMYRMYVAAGFGNDPAEESQDYCSITVFDFTPRVLTINITGNGSVRVKNIDDELLHTCESATCNYGLPEGLEVILEPSPTEGHLSWENACSGTGVGKNCSLTMDTNKVASATFSTDPIPPQSTTCVSPDEVRVGAPATFIASGGGESPYTWEIKKTDNGGTTWTLISDGNVVINGITYATASLDGNKLTLTFNSSAAGQAFNLQVTGNGSNATPGNCQVGDDGSIEPKITLTINIIGNGSVTGNGINCSSNCVEEVNKNAEINLTASPDEGWSFSAWQDCDNSSDNTCNIKMNTSKTVTATFGSEPTPPDQLFEFEEIKSSNRFIKCSTPRANCSVNNGNFITWTSSIRRYNIEIKKILSCLTVEFTGLPSGINWNVQWYKTDGDLEEVNLEYVKSHPGNYYFVITGNRFISANYAMGIKITAEDHDGNEQISQGNIVFYSDTSGQEI
ncbi:MAG TPA: hypothetical protein ENN31_00895 [Candidatus Vogelbacteria bacterium]|nr:hypothetical protein [Candidatus Vogelbacteria bacterium]